MSFFIVFFFRVKFLLFYNIFDIEMVERSERENKWIYIMKQKHFENENFMDLYRVQYYISWSVRVTISIKISFLDFD